MFPQNSGLWTGLKKVLQEKKKNHSEFLMNILLVHALHLQLPKMGQ